MLCITRTMLSKCVCVSVRPSVCLSVHHTPVFCLNRPSWKYHHTCSQSGIATPVKFFYTKRYGNIPTETRNGGVRRMYGVWKTCDFRSITYPNFRMVPFSVTLNPLFDAGYLRNGTRYEHSYNGIGLLISTYTRPILKGVISNDIELVQYLMTRSIARSHCDSWASCSSPDDSWPGRGTAFRRLCLLLSSFVMFCLLSILSRETATAVIVRFSQ